MRARRIGASALFLLATVGCGSGKRLPVVEVRFVSGSTVVALRAEVVWTEPARARGLMGRSSLPAGTGMLFLFPGPVADGFWMKDTLVPLDIAFVSRDRVVGIDSMTPCRADPCPITRPAVPYDRAIEANPGAFAGIAAGAAVQVAGPVPSPS